ncbi:hypothetical protein GCK72_025183 [Caenorhabditis remanei]|uniref:SET domain-containing protein n=1 Tax=Caenorhabditis remanei TaxID=31234 RepID=A0A6A5G192_CAERE|nr:hypothetical protein GCK72_025183 [Caenorhabditis remanei]KAF1748716.1 hypothetical protein GCK72_025183 [Caenorhabditis remanei]
MVTGMKRSNNNENASSSRKIRKTCENADAPSTSRQSYTSSQEKKKKAEKVVIEERQRINEVVEDDELVVLEENIEIELISRTWRTRAYACFPAPKIKMIKRNWNEFTAKSKNVNFSKLSSLEPHYWDIIREYRNCHPAKSVEKNSAMQKKYLRMTIDERLEFWKNQAQRIWWHAEDRLLFDESIRQKRKIEFCKDLKKYFKMNSETPSQNVERCHHLAVKFLEFNKKKFVENDKSLTPRALPEEFEMFYLSKLAYHPPRDRMRITENLSNTDLGSDGMKIPVYSDCAETDHREVHIPESLCYDYISANVIDRASEPKLEEAIGMAEQEKNKIICSCCKSENGPVNCFNNPDCRCSMVNQRLESLQGNDGRTSFTSFKPVNFRTGSAAFYRYAAFACSEECACKGRCNNNVLFTLQKNLFQLEVFRADIATGFEVRTLNYIPAGTPVMEFRGEIMNSDRLEENLKDYSMQLTDPAEDRKALHPIIESLNFTPEYLKVLKMINKKEWHIDCKWQGNVGRHLNHSCIPNLEPFRVYQKNFTPGHVSLVLFSVKSIMPGERLTIDYGPNYKGLREGWCACGTFACRNGMDFHIFNKLNYATIRRCFEEIMQRENEDYDKLIEHWDENYYRHVELVLQLRDDRLLYKYGNDDYPLPEQLM